MMSKDAQLWGKVQKCPNIEMDVVVLAPKERCRKGSMDPRSASMNYHSTLSLFRWSGLGALVHSGGVFVRVHVASKGKLILKADFYNAWA